MLMDHGGLLQPYLRKESRKIELPCTVRPPLATTGGPTARADQHGIEGHGSGPKDVCYRTSRPHIRAGSGPDLGTRGYPWTLGTPSSVLLDIARFPMQLCAGVVVYGDIQLMQHPDSAGSPDYSLLQLAPAPLGADADA